MSQEVTRAEFDALKAEIASLRDDIKRLTALAAKDQGIPEDHIYLLSAAVSAFMGKRATIKFVRRLDDPTDSWRTQGRVTVAASHRITRTRGW